MGWSFRKSLRIGPFRLNLSKSGVGASTGAGGANISTGPRGTYASFSKFGFRFFKKLKGSGAFQSTQGPTIVGTTATTTRGYGSTQSQSLNSSNASHASHQSMSTFRAILIQNLTAKPPAPFDYEQLVLSCGLTPLESHGVSVSLLESFARSVFADGLVSEDEKSKFKQLAQQLRIDEKTCFAILHKVSQGK